MKRVGDLVPTVPKFESCGVCNADGWVTLSAGGVLYQKRCRCHKIHMQKVGEALRTRNEKKK